METINAEQLGRAGVRVAEEIGYKQGYKDGATSVICDVSNWLDEDTIESLKEKYELTKTD